jgi:drug/metabolite transporter (DMT)-like permease
MNEYFNSHNKALFSIHSAALILAFTGFFANQINLLPTDIIFWRCMMAAGILFIILSALKHKRLTLNRNEWLILILCGALSAAHWATYFAAMQTAGWGLGTLALFTFPMMTVLLEPVFYRGTNNNKHLLHKKDLVLAGVMFTGAACLAIPDLLAGNGLNTGLIYGLVSAFVWSFRNILFRKHLSKYSAWQTMKWQLVVAVICLMPFLSANPLKIISHDWLLLFILAGFVTALPHSLVLYSMKELPAKTASMIACLQPVYAIIFAFLIFQEALAWQAILGGLFILAAALFETISFKQRANA